MMQRVRLPMQIFLGLLLVLTLDNTAEAQVKEAAEILPWESAWALLVDKMGWETPRCILQGQRIYRSEETKCCKKDKKQIAEGCEAAGSMIEDLREISGVVLDLEATHLGGRFRAVKFRLMNESRELIIEGQVRSGEFFNFEIGNNEYLLSAGGIEECSAVFTLCSKE